MGKLKVYDVTVNGQKTRMKLTDEDAERLDGSEVKARTAKKAAPNKKRTTKSEG